MDRAEELALMYYPVKNAEYIQESVHSTPQPFDGNAALRIAYISGYHQAEKDLELTWEDISIIRQIIFDYNREIRNEMSIPQDEEYCKEVLRRFNEENEEKVTLHT